jgi:hypothetical protein
VDLLLTNLHHSFNFSRLVTNLPSSGLTANTLGTEIPTGSEKVIPGELLTLASFPCPPPGTQLPGIIDSVDSVLIVKDALGPVCLSGLFVIIEPVGNPPVSLPPPAAPSAPSSYPTSTGWGTASGAYSYSTYSSAATYSSAWSS